jgi:outer membrane protein assembly factor BamB
MTQALVQLDTPESNRRRIWAASALACAIAAGAFTLTVLLRLVWVAALDHSDNPLTNPAIVQLRKKLDMNPNDEQAKKLIREVDLGIVGTYFERRAVLSRGGYLLLGGVVLLVGAIRTAAALRKQPPMPQGPRIGPADLARDSSIARWSVSVMGLAAAGTLAGLLSLPITPLPAVPQIVGPDNGAEIVAPPYEPLPAGLWERNWPMFRGPTGTGVAVSTAAPLDWDGATGRNILWKIELPLAGMNSPVVWEGMIYLAGGTEQTREVWGIDAKDGSMKWRQTVGGPPPTPPEIHEGTGWAPSTLATDGRRVFAIFPTGDLAAFDLAGKPLWSKSLGLPQDNHYGHSSSLLTWRDRLIVVYDQGAKTTSGKSVIYGFECATGKQVWKESRAVAASWASPILIEVGGQPQIVTAANPFISTHDPATGKEIWRAKAIKGEVGPSPIFADGLVYGVNDGADLVAIKPDGKGDVTKTHVAWKYGENLPNTVSPLSCGGAVLMVTSAGAITSVDAADGKELWTDSINGKFTASPVLVGRHVLVFDEKGNAYVLPAGKTDKLTILKTLKLDARIAASPAVVGDRIYIRAQKIKAPGQTGPLPDYLFCIGPKG